MQHNGSTGKLYFSTLHSAAYTNYTTSSNVYVQRNFKFSTKGKMVHVLDTCMHYLVFINPSLSVSVFTVYQLLALHVYIFHKNPNNLIFMAHMFFESIHPWVKETYHLK